MIEGPVKTTPVLVLVCEGALGRDSKLISH